MNGTLFTIITACKRSLGQGNIFTGVCRSFCPQGGGLCMMSLPVWLPGPMFLPGVSVTCSIFLPGSLCLGEGISVQGVSVQWSLCPRGGPMFGGLYLGFLLGGNLCPGDLCLEDLYLGVFV